MTVAELIDKLRRFDPEKEVGFSCEKSSINPEIVKDIYFIEEKEVVYSQFLIAHKVVELWDRGLKKVKVVLS